MNAIRSSLKCFFSYAHRAGYVPQDPARLIRRAICGAPPPRWLSEVDQERLVVAMAAGMREPDRRDHMLFHLMLATGIRLGSALGLDVEDVELDQGEILLRQAKGNRVERVFLNRRTRNSRVSPCICQASMKRQSLCLRLLSIRRKIDLYRQLSIWHGHSITKRNIDWRSPLCQCKRDTWYRFNYCSKRR